MAEEPSDQRTVPVNLGILKTALDWGIKGIGLLWLAFQFYSNQNQLLKSTSITDAKLTTLESKINQMDREFSDQKSDIKALKQQVDDQKEFDRETRHK